MRSRLEYMGNRNQPGRHRFSSGLWTASTVAAGAVLILAASLAAAADAKGPLTLQSKSGPISVAIKHAYLVKGPDIVEPTKTIRRLILSTTDLKATLEACKAMNCTDGSVTEGMTVDFDAGPRLNYWVALRDGRVQYSGTQKPDAFKATANTAARLAGTLGFDDSAAGGAKVAIEFDAPLLKEFTKAR